MGHVLFFKFRQKKSPDQPGINSLLEKESEPRLDYTSNIFTFQRFFSLNQPCTCILMPDLSTVSKFSWQIILFILLDMLPRLVVWTPMTAPSPKHKISMKPAKSFFLLATSCISTKDKAIFGLTPPKELIQFGNPSMRTLLCFPRDSIGRELWELKWLSGVRFRTKIPSKTIYGCDHRHLQLVFGVKKYCKLMRLWHI